MAITQAQVQRIFPRGNPAHVLGLADRLNRAITTYGIDKPTWWLANISHETAGLTRFEENLNYSAARLRQVWPSRFPSDEIAARYANNPQALANLVYANRMGNGSPASGDGYRFRGQGYPQITGRDMFARVGAVVGLPLTDHPEMASLPDSAANVAGAYWRVAGMSNAATFEDACRRWNGGTIGLAERVSEKDRIAQILLS